MFKAIFWITFLCIFTHYADKIAYNEQRLAYQNCVDALGASLCEKRVPDPPLERFVAFLSDFATDDSIVGSRLN